MDNRGGDFDSVFPAAALEANRAGRLTAQQRQGWATRSAMRRKSLLSGAVLAIAMLGRHDDLSAAGARIYFWARVLYVPVYAAGVPVARTMIWAVSIFGLILVLLAATAGG